MERAVRSGTWVAVMFAAACAPYAPATDGFETWRSTDPVIAADVDAFEGFLVEEGVAGVLPLADLLRSDRELASDACPIAEYVMPPRKTWPLMPPTLRLVRDVVVPAVGSVRVVSGYRPEMFNACVHGASKSSHLTFGALDLVPVNPKPLNELFEELCKTWRREPLSRNMGLGTYFDRDDATRNRDGRFHVDTFGTRTWGYDYHAASSYCVAS